MRYVITYINITKEKRYHCVIVILNIGMKREIMVVLITAAVREREENWVKM